MAPSTASPALLLFTAAAACVGLSATRTALANIPAGQPAAAADAPAPGTTGSAGTAGLRADIEIDPTAYVFSGYSLHAGVGVGRFRVDLGAFAMQLPDFVTNNASFDVSFHGYGAKLQYFLFDDQRGGFVGVDAGLARALVAARDSALARQDLQWTAGVNFGWRFALPADFYATTWLGLGYAFGAEDVELGGERFEAQRMVVFPAIHLGYQVR